LDATCGNGHDTIALAEFVGAPTTGTLIAVDIQETAVERTRDRLLELFQTKFGTVPLHMRTESTGGLVGYRLWTDTGFIAEIRQHPHEAIDRRLLQSWFRDRPNAPSKIKAAVYNLGYLPGPDSDKYIRTNAAGTVHSLMRVQKLIVPEGGIISISCYVGHDGGIEEETAVQQWAQALSTSSWTVVAHQWLNRPQAPSLIIAERFVSKKHLVARS
jgi:SAM-dependent methyltransferase